MLRANKQKSNPLFAKILTASSFVALVASFWQAAERINMLKNPGLDLNCNLNPVVDCGGVMSHRLAALFGFPNTFIGMVMFSILLAAGIFMLLGNSLNKRAMNFVMILASIALLFSFWFFGVSLYVIGKICLFCLAIWPATIILFWYSLIEWLSDKKRKGWVESLYVVGSSKKVEVIVSVFAVMGLSFLNILALYAP